MTRSTVDEVAEQRFDHMSRVWFLDPRVQLISDGIVKYAVAGILGNLMADPESHARTVEFTQEYGTYTIEHVVIQQVSRHNSECLAGHIAQSLGRILGRDVKRITYSAVDEKGFITFTYTAE